MDSELVMAPESVRIAAMKILGIRQMPSTAIEMCHDQCAGEWMTASDEQGKQELQVYCPDRLREFVTQMPKRSQHLLAKTLPEPVGYWGVQSAFAPCQEKALVQWQRRTASTLCADRRSCSWPKLDASMPRSGPSPARAPRSWPTIAARRVAQNNRK